MEKCILLGMLAVFSRSDIRTKKLPMIPLLLFGILGVGIFGLKRSFTAWELLGGIAVGGLLLLCSFVSREKIGRGDGYLFCVTGIFLGFRENLVLLMVALLLSAGGAGLLLFCKRCARDFRIPFVPFVLAANVLLLCR